MVISNHVWNHVTLLWNFVSLCGIVYMCVGVKVINSQGIISWDIVWALKRARVCLGLESCLTAESVKSTALALKSVDDVHGGHGLPLGVLGVGDGITDDVLEEHLQDTTGLLVDKSGDTLDTTTASQTADGGLGDTLDVIAQYLAMTLGATLSETLSSFTTSRHVYCSTVVLRIMTKFNTEHICSFSPRVRGLPYVPGFQFLLENAILDQSQTFLHFRRLNFKTLLDQSHEATQTDSCARSPCTVAPSLTAARPGRGSLPGPGSADIHRLVLLPYSCDKCLINYNFTNIQYFRVKFSGYIDI